MRDRLIELCENIILSCKASLCADCEHNNIDYPNCMGVHFTDHLLANGVIVPLVSVGQTVWFIRNKTEIITTCVEKVILKHGGLYIKLCCNSMYETTCNSIGKTVFLSREEAEKALEGGK